MANQQPVENWLQRLEDFAVQTSQFAQRKGALPKRAILLPMQGPSARILSRNTRLELINQRTAGDVSGGEQIVMLGKNITAQGAKC